ncbi:hypothetical protein [Ruminococcus sp. XPD3002]|uniref:hypothetical protein n=1 Tax=Ruminococcus sp. XPD3002 TaxID=1452269 RepID=UPI000914A408|nr:hypothetical protein SAMN04487832_1113 [Ruminococcus flavefaciens]
MNEQKKNEMTWWERNKHKVFIISGGVATVGVGVLVFKNKDTLISLIKNGKELSSNISQIADPSIIKTASELTTVVDTETITVSKSLNNGLPFEVKGGIRNLSKGHPSAEKIAQAAALGIELGEHQTIVDSYMKNLVQS